MKGDFETKRPWPEILLGVVLVTTLLLLLHTEPTITGYAVFGSSVSNVTYDVERVVLPQETYTLELEDNVIVRGIVVVGYYIASKDSSIIARLDSGTISHDLSLRSNVITGMAIGAGEIESGVIEKDLANMTLLRYGDGPYDIDNDGIVGRHGAVDYYVETNASCVLWSIVGDYVDLFCQGTVDCCDNYLLQSVDENPNYLVLDRQRAGSDRGEVLAKADDYDFSRMLPYDFTGAEERLVRLDDECLGRCNIRMETSSISIQSSAYLHIDSIVVYYDEIITDEIIDGFIDDISVRGRFIEAGLEEKIRNENVRVLVVRDESLIDDRISYEGVGVAGVIARARGMVESKIVDNQILDSLLDDDTVIGLYEDKPIEFFYDTSDYQSYHSFPEGSYGSGVRICVVDSGVDLDQIDSSVSYSVVSVDDGPFVDTVGHGTLVSRLITGLIPGAEYVFVKVDRDGVAYESDLISALELCSEYDSDVVSLSLGSGSYDGFCSAHPVSDVISELSESGMLVVAAAGNDGPGTVRMPACSPDVLSVARVDLDGELVSGSSFVQGLSVFGALGEFAGYTGTSFSSPAVSAGVSVLLSEGVGKEGAFSRIVHTGDYYENVSYSVLNVSRALLGEETNSLWDDRIVDEGEDEDGDIVFLDVSVDSVGIIPSPQAFSSEDLVGYCNASGDGNVTRFDYEWKKNGTVEYRGVYFKEGSISAGEAHSCGVRANDSRVLCWGWNSYGQLGDGTTDQRENPTLTSDSSGFVSVSAGTWHSCGVRANDSRVLCWGWNSNGGLGDGTTDNRLVPTLTSDSSGFVSVSAGTYHSCGVRANDSRVLCWGYNGNGQLGDGTTDQRENPTLTSDSSSYYHGFSSSTEYNISVLQSGFTSLNDEWTLSCRAVFGEEYTAWEESDVTTIVPPSECGVISSPGSHVLNRDLNSTGTCITINVSDVSINCLGHTINYSTNDEEGYGILIWSQSDTVENVSIANCNIIKESPGGSSGSRRPAILGYGYSDTPSGGFTKSGDEHTVEHVSISNVTITTEGDHARGIFVLSGHTWSVEDVSITTYGDDARGVYSETSDYWNLSSVDITTFGTVGIGLYVIDANHYYLKDIDITAASAGMWIRTGSSNWRAENISINATLQGIATSDGGMAHMSFYNSTIHSSGSRGLDTNQGTDNISFYDSTITAPSSDDVYMRLGDASRRVSFVNVTFNPSSVTFHDSSSGFLDVGWWVDAYIDDPDDDPIEGVNISWADSGSVSGNPTALGWMLTDSHGSARTYVFEHTRSHTGTYSYNDYTFNITSTLLDVAFLDESYEITDNIELYYTLGNATLSIWDGTKPQGGSNLYSIGLDVPFYAEYLRLNDSTPITTASCTIAFDSGSGYGVGQSMTYNASSEYYEYGSDFPSGGFYDYQVTCTSDYTGRTQTSTFGYGDFSVVDVELVHEEDYEVSYAVIGTPAYNTTDWRSEGVSLAVVNMPFTVNESSSDTGAIADLSTYHNNGTLINAPTWEDDCVIGGCYRFDPDSEQYIEIADSVSLNFTDDLSFSVWVYRDGWSENWANIFSKGNDAYLFRRSYNTDRLYLTVWNATGGYFDLETTTNIDTGTWYHIAGVYSVTEDRAELYVNGFLEDSDPPIGPIRQVSDPMGLGARYRIGSGADRYWDGLIDGFVLYDRALSQEQIQAIHAAESQGRSVNTFDGPYDGSAVSVRVYSSETTEYVYADSNELRRFDQCGVIDESGSYALVDDVSASGTCFTINTSDVSLDCSGYTINYSQSSVGYGILVTGGNSNINISNCGIFQGGTSSDSRGILLNGSASNTINNIVIDNIEGDGRGLSNINILTNATNNINVSNINLTNSGEGGVIILFTNNTNISLKDSYGNCTGADCVVFYMRASSNSLSTNLSAFSSASDSYLFLFLGGTNNTLDGFIGNNTGAVTYGSGSLAVLQSYTNATINNATVISTSIDSFAINSMVHTVNVTNSYFSTSSGNDIGVWWGTNKPVIYLINTTYEDININSDSEAILHRGWYIDFFVNDTSGNPVNNVNVSWNDAGTISGTPSSIGWNITDGSGLSARNILYQYSQNFTNRYYHTNYTFNAIADGYVGLFGESRNFTGNTQLNFTMIVDIYPPTWSNPWDNSTDTSPRINENIRMNLTLNDDVDLFSYTFSWNGTGSWTNDSIQLISGTEHILSVIKQVGLPRDNTIGWRVYFNDTSENSNTSDIFTFTVKNTPPLLDSINANVSYVKSDDSIMISTDGASDADGDDLRLECGDAPELSNLCIGSYGGGERTCTFSSPWSDNTEHTIYCRVYDGINVSTPDRTTAVTSDNLPPQVSIVIPEETSYNITTFNLEYTYTELYCDVVWWGNLTHNSSTQDCGLNWTGLTASEGSNTWSVWMRDLAGNTNSSSVTFTVDTVEPVLSVVSPLNDTYWNTSSINLSIGSDKPLSWCGLSVDGASNISMNLNGSSNGAWYYNSSMPDAEYEWRVWCNDTVNNWGSTDLYSFTVDTVSPQVYFVSPTPDNDVVVGDDFVFVNVTSSDLNRHYSFVDWDNSLVGWWRFESNNGTHTMDESGNDNHGLMVGSTQTETGKFGKGMEFDGDYVQLPDSIQELLHGNPEASLSMWIKLDHDQNNAGNSGIIQLSGFDNSNGNLYYYTGAMRDGGIWLDIFRTDRVFTGDWQPTIPGVEWHNLVVTTTPGSNGWKMYINGIKRYETTGQAQVSVNSNLHGGFRIGQNSGGRHLRGLIDEVMIFNRSLSQEEVNSLYNSTVYQYSRNFSGLDDGSYSFRGYAVDAAGNLNMTELRVVGVDTVEPVLTVISPLNDTFNASSSIVFNVTSDKELSWCGLSVDGASNVSMDLFGDGLGASYINASMADAEYEWRVWCNDTVGNWGSIDLYSFVVDTTFPQVSIVYPESIAYNSLTHSLNYTFVELYCDVVWWGNLTHNSSTQDCGLNWTGLTASEGSNTWSVWMRDLAGNTNSSSVTFTVDTVELVLSVVSPLNDTFNASSSIVFNVTSDKELSWCGLSVDGASNVSMSLFGDGLGASYINASMADAEYEWRVWCNDTVGNWGSIDLYSFVVDTVPPLIDIISPQNITYNDPNILVNISVTELHIETILFTNSTGQNETYTTPDTRLWNEGPNTMIVYANDSAGNINTTTVTFTVDTVLPEIQLINPVNNSNINRSEVIFSVASTKELSWCGLSVNGADNITMDINGTGNGASYTNSTMPDNNYNFIVYCNDTVNNYGNTQLKHFLIDTIYPSVMFVDPTRNNGSYLKDDYVYVNVSSTDSNHHYTMLDWDNSLVGWWRFESNNGTHTFDDSGNDNHGNIIGATQTEAGMFGRGMEFDGDGNYVNTDSILIPSEDNWTLSTWINVPQNPMLVHGTIFSQHNSGMFYAYTTFGSADGHLRFNGVDGTTEILVGSDIRGTGWRHLVLLRDGSSFRLYLDGNLDSTGSSTGSVNTAQNFRLGHGEAGGLRWFDGIIDEVIIMNRALSLEEIQALYSATASQYEKNFSQLEDGTYSFRAYSVDKGGNKNQTESREIIVDTISPSVAFVPPTPDDQQELGVDYVYINVTSSDANDHYTFLDYDESLRGWWRFEETNGTHIFDESSTNLALNPGFADGTTNGWSDAGGLGGIITGGLYSSYSFNLTSGEGTAHILRNSLELSPGTYYMQVWYEHIEGHVPYFFTSGFEGSINIITDFITGPGIRKAEVILTVTANTQHPSIRYAAAAPADRTEGITIIHAIQIEEGNKGTGFSYQNHGILSGSTIGITEYGRFGRGIDLHAGTDHVVIPYSESLVNDVFGLTDVFTISAWSYPRAWENWATIINYANGSSWSNTLNGMWAYESGYRCVMGAGADGNPGGSVIGPNYNPGSSGLNQWYHVVCVADGTDIHIYVDGVHRGSSAISGLTHPRGEIIGPVTIGRRTPGSGPSFNGTIDDIIVFSRALTLDEVRALYDSTANQYRNNFTSQEGGEHTFRAYSVDIVGNKNETGLRTVTIDTVGPTWSDPWDNSTDNTPRINENIRMNLTLHDDADLASYRFSWNGTGSWTNDSIQYISGTEHTLSVVKTVGLPRNSTIGWRVYFNDSSGKSNVSDIFTFTIKNTPPQTPILEYPEDEDDLFINRTPTFNWTATDADDDELTFNIQVALDDGFSAIILDESGLSTNEYYQGIPLELDTQYYWRVMANDSYDTSDWSDSSTFTTVPYTSITLDNDNIDFGTLRINEQNDTEDNNPIPIIVRNTGNIEANISLNATSFWTTQPLDTPFYQYKARSFLTNSFDIGTSQMTYHNMSTTRLLAISRLEWHENNTGYIDLRVLAPAAEPPGPKSSTIYITGVAS